MNIERDKLILMHQTHSNKVVEIKKNNYKKKVIADAMITKMKGFALGVVTADCVPIILYDAKNEIVKEIPLKRMGSTEDVTLLVAFLISQEASYITGQTISVDGGLYMY